MGVDNTLDGCLPDLVTAYNALTDAAAAVGISFAINDYGGLRTPTIEADILQFRQSDYNAAVAAGEIPANESIDVFRPIADTTGYGNSFHDFGAAFDVSPFAWPSGMSYDSAVSLLGSLAGSAGLRWPLPSSDPAHFELPVTLAYAAAEYSAFIGAIQSGGSPGSFLSLLALAAVAVGLWFGFGSGSRRSRRLL